MSRLFPIEEFIVRENFNVASGGAAYNFIEKDSGNKIFSVCEKSEHKLLALLRKTHFDSVIPFCFSFFNHENVEIFRVKKPLSFGRMIIEIRDAGDKIIGFLTQSFPTWKNKFFARDNHGKIIAKISGNLLAWNFLVEDMEENILAEFSKIHGSITEELLISVGDYSVKIFPNKIDNELFEKIIAAAVVSLDLIYRKQQE